MLFNYKALTNTGIPMAGDIEAVSVDTAIGLLQKRGLIISEIHSPEEKKFAISFFSMFNHVSNKDVVILSRQMATLFTAQVSALRIFRLLGSQVENPVLQKHLLEISDDIQGGSSISTALGKFPDAFSSFYVNMVKAGEESGKLDETFNYLADYLDRTYQVTSKAKNALIYPAFVISTFIGVMVLMLTVIIPKISVMITDSGQPIPFYTQAVLGISNIMIHYGIFVLIGVIIAGFGVYKYAKTPDGSLTIDQLRLQVP